MSTYVSSYFHHSQNRAEFSQVQNRLEDNFSLTFLPKNTLFSIYLPPVTPNSFTPIKIVPSNAIYFPYHPENAANRPQQLTWLDRKSPKV